MALIKSCLIDNKDVTTVVANFTSVQGEVTQTIYTAPSGYHIINAVAFTHQSGSPAHMFLGYWTPDGSGSQTTAGSCVVNVVNNTTLTFFAPGNNVPGKYIVTLESA